MMLDLKSEAILKWVSCIVFGIPVQGATGNQFYNAGVHRHAVISGMLVLCMWFSFSFDMYCAKTYWRGDQKPQIPTETLLLLILLNLSGAVSFSLMLWYFYSRSNEFHHSQTRLVPHFSFMPDGQQIDVGPTRNNWKYVNAFFIVGVVGIAFVLYCDVGLDVFFDFEGLHNFTHIIHDWRKGLYYFSVGCIYWGFTSVVVASCIFYICCRDIVRHIEYTEELIITKAKKFLTARHYHDSLLRYAEDVMNSMKIWFAIHSLFFIIMIISAVYEWITAFSREKNKNVKANILIAQAAGSFLIAFMFVFPILAASRVTAKFDKMYRKINRKWRPDKLPEVDVFMNYSLRCEAGFKLFGIKLTAQLALIALLSCFLGFFKLYKKVV